MDRLESTDEKHWIDNRIVPLKFDVSFQSVTVAHLIPDGFSAYARLLPPYYVDTRYGDGEETWEGWDRRVDLVWPDYVVECQYTGLIDGVRPPVMTWQEMATAAGVDLVPETQSGTIYGTRSRNPIPRRLIPTGESHLDAATWRDLAMVLASHTTGQVYAGYWWLAIGDFETTQDRVYRVVLDEVPDMWSNEELGSSPNYVWPEDRSWCVHTDYDLDTTYIGGGRALVSDLLAKDGLEVIEVAHETRVDERADRSRGD
jgi:hypothetical protein